MIFFILYTSFFCALKAVYSNEHCSGIPINTTMSQPSGLMLVSFSKCPDLASILLWEVDVTGWPGPAQIPGGAREGCGGFSQARITAVFNYHKQMLAAWLIRNAIQSPWQSNPLSENSRDRETVCTPNSHGQVNESYPPCPRGSPQFTPQHAMSRDTFGCHNLKEEAATGIEWVEFKVLLTPTVHRTVPSKQRFILPKCQ